MRKEKKTKEQLELEREQRLDNAEKRLRLGIASLEKSKVEFFNGMVEARNKNLRTQEQQYRATLGKCMAQIKMQTGTLMTLRLARQSRDLVKAQREFVECLGLISEDIVGDQKKTNVKKAENQYLKAKYAVDKQSENIDSLLDLDRYSDIADAESGKYSEFDSEIDDMLKDADMGITIDSRNRNKM